MDGSQLLNNHQLNPDEKNQHSNQLEKDYEKHTTINLLQHIEDEDNTVERTGKKETQDIVSELSLTSIVKRQLLEMQASLSNNSGRHYCQPQHYFSYPYLPPPSPPAATVSNRSVALIETPQSRPEEIRCPECCAFVCPENFKKHVDDHELLKKTQTNLTELAQTNRTTKILKVLAFLLSFVICCSTISFPISCNAQNSCLLNFGEITIFKFVQWTRGKQRYSASATDQEFRTTDEEFNFEGTDRSAELFAELTKAKKDAEIAELKQAKEKAEAETKLAAAAAAAAAKLNAEIAGAKEKAEAETKLAAAAKLNAEIAGAKEKAEAEKREAETKLAAAAKLNALQLKQAKEDGYLQGTLSNALQLKNLALTIEESEAKRNELEQEIISLMIEKKDREREIMKEHKNLIEKLRRGNPEPQERELENEEEEMF